CDRGQRHPPLHHSLCHRRGFGRAGRVDRGPESGGGIEHRHRRSRPGLRDQRDRRTGQHRRLSGWCADRGNGDLVRSRHSADQSVCAGVRLHHHDRCPDRPPSRLVRPSGELIRRFAHPRWAAVVLLALFVAAVPALAGQYENLNPDASSRYLIFLGTSALVLALWAISYNLMLGYTGMVSFAHAAYYGVGAYTVALIFKRYHLPILLGLAAAPLAAAAVGVVTGLVAQRAVRLYFSLLTLAISPIASLFAGMAGGLFILYQQQAYPEMLYWTANAQPVVVTLLGGTTTFLGPAIGAFIYVVLDNAVSKQFPYQFDIILGAIVLGVVLAVPGGISDAPTVFLRLRERFHRGEQAEAPPAESAGEAIRMFDVRKA